MSTHRQTVAIAYETAARAIAIAMEVGAEHDVRVVAAVTDPSMTLIAYGMADDATPHSAETSRRKAATAASVAAFPTCTGCFRAWRSAGGSGRERCRAASSRCSRSAARS